jgi:hypothetical protein
MLLFKLFQTKIVFIKNNMDHVAIMNKKWNLISKILSGEKIIESRWYKTKRTPWDKINVGDVVYFKNSGEKIVAKAFVLEVLQFEINSFDDMNNIIKKYGDEICLINRNAKTWGKLSKYCILIRLCNPKLLKEPFQINKKGFGISTAWITINDIEKIKL